MRHTFSPVVASDVGVNAAVIFEHILFWIRHNEANKTNFRDGQYWTFNSAAAFQVQFPYLSKSQISTALQKLIECGYIVTGNYNSTAFDRTLWYALGENGKRFDKNDKSISDFSEMENRNFGNPFPANQQPIPYTTTDNITDNPPLNPPTGGNAADAAVYAEMKARICRLFNRRENTQWSEKETRQLKAISKRKGVLGELTEIEALYSSGWLYRRRDVITFLNNFTVELDRARGNAPQAQRNDTPHWGANERGRQQTILD